MGAPQRRAKGVSAGQGAWPSRGSFKCYLPSSSDRASISVEEAVNYSEVGVCLWCEGPWSEVWIPSRRLCRGAMPPACSPAPRPGKAHGAISTPSLLHPPCPKSCLRRAWVTVGRASLVTLTPAVLLPANTCEECMPQGPMIMVAVCKLPYIWFLPMHEALVSLELSLPTGHMAGISIPSSLYLPG